MAHTPWSKQRVGISSVQLHAVFAWCCSILPTAALWHAAQLAAIDWSKVVERLKRMQASPSPVHKMQAGSMKAFAYGALAAALPCTCVAAHYPRLAHSHAANPLRAHLQELLFFVDEVHEILEQSRDVHGMEAVGADDMLPLVVHILLTSVPHTSLHSLLHAITHTLSHSHSHAHSLSLTRSLTLTHTLTHFPSHNHTLTLSHSHTLTLSHSHTLTLTYLLIEMRGCCWQRIALFEAEAEYLWGLLDPALLNGEVCILLELGSLVRFFSERLHHKHVHAFTAALAGACTTSQGGYYLTTLSSAIHVIKTFNPQTHPRLRAPSVDDMQGALAPLCCCRHPHFHPDSLIARFMERAYTHTRTHANTCTHAHTHT